MWVSVKRSCNRWESQNGSESISQGISSSSCSFDVIRMAVDLFTKCALFLLGSESSKFGCVDLNLCQGGSSKYGVSTSFVFISWFYQVFAKVRNVVYRLELPDEFSGIYPFFHVIHLREGLDVEVSYIPLDEIIVSN